MRSDAADDRRQSRFGSLATDDLEQPIAFLAAISRSF
jgi:hypothetical protein